MRTTVRIDDDLYRSVKERAAREGRTVAAVLEDAVRIGMEAPVAETDAAVDIKKIRAGGLRSGVDLSSNASVQEALDRDLPLEKLR